MKLSSYCAVAISLLALVVSATAQTSPSTSETSSASVQVPRLIKFSGIAKDETGKPMSCSGSPSPFIRQSKAVPRFG